MATESTPLLAKNSFIVEIPSDSDYECLIRMRKSDGLSLEELMPFQDDPWWQNVRRTFFLSFWLTLIVIFTTACTLSILQHGSCAAIANATKQSSPSITASVLQIFAAPPIVSTGTGNSLAETLISAIVATTTTDIPETTTAGTI